MQADIRIHSTGSVWRTLCMAAALGLSGSVSGCGEDLSGTYEGSDAGDSLEFKDGRVYVTTMGQVTAGEYELDGDRVILTVNGSSLVLRRNGDRFEGGAIPLSQSYRKRAETAAKEGG